MKILVTGGAGFIGSHIVELGLAKGHQMAVLDNLSTGKRENVPAGVPFYEMDVCDPAVFQILEREKPDGVTHQAAQVSVSASVREPFGDAQTNIIGSLNVLEACRRVGINHVVFASSGGTCYGEVAEGAATEQKSSEPSSPYGISKFVAEKYLFWYGRQHGFMTTSLRYANVYGPRQDPFGEAGVVAIFSKTLLEGSLPTIHGDGGCIRDYVFGGDAAAANLLAMERGYHGVFNVGTGRGTTVNELFGQLCQISGISVSAHHGPPRPGDLLRNVLSVEKMKKEWGWSPKCQLEQGLLETLAFFKSLRKA